MRKIIIAGLLLLGIVLSGVFVRVRPVLAGGCGQGQCVDWRCDSTCDPMPPWGCTTFCWCNDDPQLCNICGPGFFVCNTPPSYCCPIGAGLCGSATKPACQGICSEGTVCRFNQGNNACVCGTANSCNDYARDPDNLVVTRVQGGPNARITWTAPTNWQYVDRQAVIVGKPANIMTCVLAAYNKQSTTACEVYESNLAKTVGSYDVVGRLAPGTWYEVRVLIFPGVAPPPYNICAPGQGAADLLSSCQLTDDPTQVEVGTQKTMTTNVVSGILPYRVSYAETNGTGSVSLIGLNPDVLYPAVSFQYASMSSQSRLSSRT
jgi:hypothetical protein